MLVDLRNYLMHLTGLVLLCIFIANAHLLQVIVIDSKFVPLSNATLKFIDHNHKIHQLSTDLSGLASLSSPRIDGLLAVSCFGNPPTHFQHIHLSEKHPFLLVTQICDYMTESSTQISKSQRFEWGALLISLFLVSVVGKGATLVGQARASCRSLSETILEVGIKRRVDDFVPFRGERFLLCRGVTTYHRLQRTTQSRRGDQIVVALLAPSDEDGPATVRFTSQATTVLGPREWT